MNERELVKKIKEIQEDYNSLFRRHIDALNLLETVANYAYETNNEELDELLTPTLSKMLKQTIKSCLIQVERLENQD